MSQSKFSSIIKTEEVQNGLKSREEILWSDVRWQTVQAGSMGSVRRVSLLPLREFIHGWKSNEGSH